MLVFFVGVVWCGFGGGVVRVGLRVCFGFVDVCFLGVVGLFVGFFYVFGRILLLWIGGDFG
ncbi:hypothetical protein RA274_28035, partial [Pseudomonas syringae pv. tagetis]|uniref:hypothetical protein n=1 Tax=Pseudomonas syringae group genomosp. 7 TaxID=251699 RepID=UPI00376FA537